MTGMPRGFWQQVLASDMAVPEDRPLNELTAELVTMLGSTNPVERDETAYPVLATWLSEGVYDDLLVSFGDSIAQGLVVGLGKSLDDSSVRAIGEMVHQQTRPQGSVQGDVAWRRRMARVFVERGLRSLRSA